MHWEWTGKYICVPCRVWYITRYHKQLDLPVLDWERMSSYFTNYLKKKEGSKPKRKWPKLGIQWGVLKHYNKQILDLLTYVLISSPRIQTPVTSVTYVLGLDSSVIFLLCIGVREESSTDHLKVKSEPEHWPLLA